jgi:ABC-type protease/lipase transport system fused ATPase/permease subunit
MIASSLLMARALAPVEQAVSGWKGWTSALAASRRLTAGLQGAEEAENAVTLPAPKGRL